MPNTDIYHSIARPTSMTKMSKTEGQIYPMTCFVYRVYWHTAMLIHWYTVITIMTDQSSCHRDLMSLNALYIYHLLILRESWPTLGLEQRFWNLFVLQPPLQEKKNHSDLLNEKSTVFKWTNRKCPLLSLASRTTVLLDCSSPLQEVIYNRFWETWDIRFCVSFIFFFISSFCFKIID